MLTSTPLRNEAAQTEGEEGDRLVVRVPRDRPWWLRIPLVAWIVAVGKERRLTLDRLGSEIWNLCDGQRTVEEAIDVFAERHALTFHEARVAVTGYLKALVQRGALAVELPEEHCADSR